MLQDADKVWLNGKIVQAEEAKIPIFSHEVNYATGSFEGLRFYQTENGPSIFKLEEHINRIIYSTHSMFMEVPFTKDELIEGTKEAVRITGLSDGYIRPLIFNEGTTLSVFPKDVKVSVAIGAWPWPKYFEKEGLNLQTAKMRRAHPLTTDLKAKTVGGYLELANISTAAHIAKYDDALILDTDGYIAEGPSASFFVVRGDTIYTALPDKILPGITRDTIITLANDAGYKVIEGNFTRDGIQGADEAFFCGTAVEVMPILSLDDVAFTSKDRPVTSKLQELYSKAVRGELPGYEHWNTLI